MTAPVLRVRWVKGTDPVIPLPAYTTSKAAGADLRANPVVADHAKGITLAPGACTLIPTGPGFEIPAGCKAQFRPRSVLVPRHGITPANAPATIDADYRGQIDIILINSGQASFVAYHGARIAQLVLAPVIRARVKDAASLSETARSSGGFGSTGRS